MASIADTSQQKHLLAHDDIAHAPEEHVLSKTPTPNNVSRVIPTRANRERARERLTLIKSRPEDAKVPWSSSSSPSSPPPSQQQHQHETNVEHAIFLRAREMCEQSDAAFLKGVSFRRDALRDWLALIVLRVVAIIILATRGARPLFYVETLLLVFYDLPAVLGAIWLLQPIVAYVSVVAIVTTCWTVAEVVIWFVVYQFNAHHRHWNGGAFVGWLGFIVLVGLLGMSATQMRNFANLLDAILLHAETITTMADVARSASHDVAFRHNATEAGHVLAASSSSSTTAPSATGASPSIPLTATKFDRWISTVPILGRLFQASTMALSSPTATEASTMTATTERHVKAV